MIIKSNVTLNLQTHTFDKYVFPEISELYWRNWTIMYKNK